MKNAHLYILKYTILGCFCSLHVFSQSITILPEKLDNNSDVGENINITSNHEFLGLSTNRFNGTFSTKTPVISGETVLNISGGG